MSEKSLIEWTEGTWNPLTGCTKISEGCKNCYAEKLAKRLQGTRSLKYRNGFELTLHHDCLSEPLKWKKARRIFVCSIGDLFHEEVPESFILEVFSIMNKAKHHVFQVLTKRSGRLREISNRLNWTENIWAGVTVESDKHLHRISALETVRAKVRFLSLEPLLSQIAELPLGNIDWVIVGGESGANARPIHKDWVITIRDKCLSSNTPFFFKQWGGVKRKMNGRLLDGKTWDQMPKLFT